VRGKYTHATLLMILFPLFILYVYLLAAELGPNDSAFVYFIGVPLILSWFVYLFEWVQKY
jgi:hypothetical protein